MRKVIPADAHLVPPQASCVFKGIIYDVYQWQQQMFDGSEKTFEMLKRPDTVKVLAIKDGKIVVLNEEQPGLRREFELPGGRHDVEAETEEDCAQREMHEETGMVFKSYKLLHVVQPFSKIEAFVYLFLATDFERQDTPHVDSGEKISVELLSFDECLARSHSKRGTYLPTEILERAGSIDGLLTLPEYR